MALIFLRATNGDLTVLRVESGEVYDQNTMFELGDDAPTLEQLTTLKKDDLKSLLSNLGLHVSNINKMTKEDLAGFLLSKWDKVSRKASAVKAISSGSDVATIAKQETTEKQEEQSQKKDEEDKKEEEETKQEDKKEEDKKEEEEGWTERDEKYLDLLRRLNAGPMKVNYDQLVDLEEKKKKWEHVNTDPVVAKSYQETPLAADGAFDLRVDVYFKVSGASHRVDFIFNTKTTAQELLDVMAKNLNLGINSDNVRVKFGDADVMPYETLHAYMKEDAHIVIIPRFRGGVKNTQLKGKANVSTGKMNKDAVLKEKQDDYYKLTVEVQKMEVEAVIKAMMTDLEKFMVEVDTDARALMETFLLDVSNINLEEMETAFQSARPQDRIASLYDMFAPTIFPKFMAMTKMVDEAREFPWAFFEFFFTKCYMKYDGSWDWKGFSRTVEIVKMVRKTRARETEVATPNTGDVAM